jgi:enterobactin synthetase component D / holo-[acyl-carrier protein] synthase
MRLFNPDGMSPQLFGLFDDPRVYVLTSAVSNAAIASLSEREAAALTNVVDKRRREFATARALAREGFERFFDVRGFDLLNAEDRSPIWPRGIEGSISHSDTRAWVALVDATFGTIGIDGEGRDELKRDLWHLTLLDVEVAYLETLDASVQGRRALTLFSAKEALYKAQYPRSGSFMSYTSLRVDLGEAGLLTCTFQEAVDGFSKGFVVHGRWLDENELVTAVWIPAQ